MDQIVLCVNFLDGTTRDVTISAGDIVKFEARFEIPIHKVQMASHLFYLAWVALARQKETAKTFDEWVETIVNVVEADPKAS